MDLRSSPGSPWQPHRWDPRSFFVISLILLCGGIILTLWPPQYSWPLYLLLAGSGLSSLAAIVRLIFMVKYTVEAKKQEQFSSNEQ